GRGSWHGGWKMEDGRLGAICHLPSPMISSGRPGEGAAAEDVEVEVEDGLLRARPVVDDEAVVREPLLLRHLPRDGEEVPDERLVGLLDGVGAGDRLTRNDED